MKIYLAGRMKIYLAGPLFTSAEQQWNSQLAEELRGLGHEVWLPQNFKPEPNVARLIFWKDIDGLNWSDIIVANMDGPDPDSGTSWECCWGRDHGKFVLAYRTDFRNIQDGFAPFNLMLHESVDKYVPTILQRPWEVASHLHTAILDHYLGTAN